MTTVATALAAAWVLLYTGACGNAMLGARRWSRLRDRACAATSETTPRHVTVIRPCAGDEPDLAARLSTSGGAGRVVFVVPSPTDASLPAIERAAAALEAANVAVTIVRMVARGPNRKAEQMAAGVAAMADVAATATIVFADSDVDLAAVDLAALIAPLAMHAAAWAPPIEAGARRTRGDLSSHATLATTLHAFPLLAAIDPRGMVGKLFATTRGALDQARGLDDLHLYIGEDMELARRFVAAGLSVAVAPLLAPSRASGRSEADVAARYLRWLHVVRAQRPALLVSYPLLIAAGPSFLLLGAIAAALRSPAVFALALFAVAVRFVVALSARRATTSTLPIRALPLLALRGDFVLLSAWARALFGRRVTWRGAVLTFGQRGRLRA